MRSQQIDDFFQPTVPHFHVAEVLHGLVHIVFAAAKFAISLLHQVENVVVGQVSRILQVGAIDDEGQGMDRVRQTFNRHGLHNLDVNIGELFALAEIRQRFTPVRRVDLKHHAAAAATAIKTKDEPWLSWCTAVLMRVDAETAMVTVQGGRQAAQMAEPGIPHQGPIAENPFAVTGRHPVPWL